MLTFLRQTARNTWRGLTSMRTALILLFLLALAALPGALLPQYSLNPERVEQYYARYPWAAPWLDRLGFFEVFQAPWFAAIYVLLFVSLIGCLVPRTFEYIRVCRAKPVGTPRNLRRLPHHASGTSTEQPDAVMSRVEDRLRGWRKVRRTEPGGVRTLSAERGYLREVGNLVFHFALLGLLISFAIGKMYGYEGQVIVLANGSQFCNSGPYAYDSFHPGLRVDGTGLKPFCVRINDFRAEYRPDGSAAQYRADVDYQTGEALTSGEWSSTEVAVNNPLRMDGTRLYVLGHGYAPRFTVTFPGGQERTGVIQWRTVDTTTLLAQGATKFDPPNATSQRELRNNQLAITGLFAPTAAFNGTLLTSVYPELRNPAVAVDVYQGDLGLNSGRSQSIFEIDQSMVESGRLERVARQNLLPGEELRLDDGTTVRFDGVEQWVSLQVSYDPSQTWVLVFALSVLGGLGLSLTIKRRRLWVRVTPADDHGSPRRSVVEIGGLARTEAAGYGEEFDRIAADVLPPAAEEQPLAGAATSSKDGE